MIFLAGLQGIPDTIMEAADLDGAGPVRKFFSITIPLLSPSIFFVSVISVIGALQVFDLIYMMLGRSNPAMPNTRTVVYLFYEAGFLDNDRGLRRGRRLPAARDHPAAHGRAVPSAEEVGAL